MWPREGQKKKKRLTLACLVKIVFFINGVFLECCFCVFCNRTPVTAEIPGKYPLDEEWHGYINDNDRVLLKVHWYTSLIVYDCLKLS